jgi:hypothetical protein
MPCIVLLSRSYDTVSIPNLDFGAQYRAYAFPCQRLVAALVDRPTHDSGFRRLATPFRTEDFHLQSLASLSRRTVSPMKVFQHSLKLLPSYLEDILPSASKIGHTEFVSNPHFTWPGNGSDLFSIGVRWE